MFMLLVVRMRKRRRMVMGARGVEGGGADGEQRRATLCACVCVPDPKPCRLTCDFDRCEQTTGRQIKVTQSGVNAFEPVQ